MGAPSSEDENVQAEGDDLSKPTTKTMTDTDTSLSTYLSLVTQYLSVFMIENATFLAERCVADHPASNEARYMLALCYYRGRSLKRALLTLDVGSTQRPSHAMRYLAAQIAMELKEYYRAEEVLLKECRLMYQRALRESGDTSFPAVDDWIVQTTPCPIPNGAAGLALLANVCRKSNRKDRAIKYYKMSLQLDPFLWTSFQALSELGVSSDYTPANAFGVLPLTVAGGSNSFPHQQPQTLAADAHKTNVLTAAKTPLQPIETPAAASTMGATFRGSFEINTPGLTPIPVNNSMTMMPLETPPQYPMTASLATPPPTSNPVVLRRAREVAARQYYPPSPETPMTNVTRSMRYLRGLGVNESLRVAAAENSIVNNINNTTPTHRNLFVSGSSVMQSENQQQQAAASSIVVGANAAVSNSTGEDTEKPDPSDPVVASILELLATMGAAYQKLCRYQCRDALSILQSLPVNQQLTGWVLHQLGRAYMEMNDFSNAQRSLEMMQGKDPGRIQGLEILSTVYWQLKKEVELASLSQRIVDLDRLSPEAWCVVGNCFSLQKDHESALLFFKRSLQIDPDFTYTHTLSGHEYMANEDFEKAMACFRQALRIDERHYNAWYGLGAIHHRQEKYDLAEYNFEKAVSINPNSSVLRCHLGIAQHANGKSYQALDTLASAFQLDPRNPQARFQRATIYSSLQRYHEALAELEKVRDAAPREATIHFAMGKVLKRLGRPEEAMKCFLTAMDLDPKDNQMIKSAMDKLDEPEVDEDNIAGF